MERVQSWMWGEACALLEEAERTHRRFFALLVQPAAEPAWEPPVNIFARDGQLLVVIALPGVDAKHIEVQLHGASLEISARSAAVALPSGAQLVRLEIPYGSMRRRIELPAAHYALREQRIEAGCLYLMLEERSDER